MQADPAHAPASASRATTGGGEASPGEDELIRLAPADVAPFSSALHRLQRAAYRVEAAIIGDDRIPALHESERDLEAANLWWILKVEAGEIIGALAYVLDEDTVDIDRLVVEPREHRRGIGRELVRHAVALAPRATVSTGRDNAPARRLYERLGFVHISDQEVLPGLFLSEYEKTHGAPIGTP